jgi:VIT1/CCC1 family predicted Fe2+/Mn2+ transporter
MPVEIEHDHSTDAIRERLEEGSEASYLRDWVYGGIDGAVTTFAIVSGVVGADLSVGVILVLGAANVVADGFSMAASNYTGTKAEIEEQDRIRDHEYRQVEHDPDGERREVREIFRNKGFEGEDLDRAVQIITADRELWVNTMMVEEYGLPPVDRSPGKAAVGTFIAFLLCGLVPLLPFCLVPWAIERDVAIVASIIGTAATFFFIGSVKARWSLVAWWRSAIETTGIGLGAAIVAYVIGYALRSLL